MADAIVGCLQRVSKRARKDPRRDRTMTKMMRRDCQDRANHNPGQAGAKQALFAPVAQAQNGKRQDRDSDHGEKQAAGLFSRRVLKRTTNPMEIEMNLVDQNNRFASELSDEDLEFVTGSGTNTTVTCTGGTKAHVRTGTDKNGNQFVTVKCF